VLTPAFLMLQANAAKRLKARRHRKRAAKAAGGHTATT